MKGQAKGADLPRIEKLQRRPRSGRIRVVLNDGRAWSLAEELVLEAGLHVDDPVDPATLAELERRDEPFRARDAALNLLSYRARSTAELRRRLLQKGFSSAVVDRCTEEMREHGYLDDAAFAGAFVRDRLRLRPRGRRRLVAELRDKGVDADTAATAVDDALAETGATEEALALEAARAWAARNIGKIQRARSDPRARAKLRQNLYAFMARRGFPPDAVRSALHAVLDDD
ncbi:MAG TPA: regulatory protein RecX [Longimicrobiales bacterium]|nr:regulatory protein RecX [Longimicrobiales bacterium]